MQEVYGPASLRRTSMFTFPVYDFVQADGTTEGKTLARLGRDGWFRVYLGRGRRVELPDGTKWRVAATGVGRYIEPIVTSSSGNLAVAAPHGRRSYSVNGRDYAYTLFSSRRSRLALARWSLREHDTIITTFESNSMVADQPVPLAAALLCFTLIKYGIPGEAKLVPEFHWA
jgi:hypothetical protein